MKEPWLVDRITGEEAGSISHCTNEELRNLCADLTTAGNPMPGPIAQDLDFCRRYAAILLADRERGL